MQIHTMIVELHGICHQQVTREGMNIFRGFFMMRSNYQDMISRFLLDQIQCVCIHMKLKKEYWNRLGQLPAFVVRQQIGQLASSTLKLAAITLIPRHHHLLHPYLGLLLVRF